MTSHLLGLFFVCLFVVMGTVVLVWNIYPPARNAMRGYSTLAEALFGLFMTAFNQIAGGIQDAQAAGFIPPAFAAYLPYVFLLYFIVKRFQTTTPVGVREPPAS